MGTPSRRGLRERAVALARKCRYDETHSLLVRDIAVSLFEQLAALHGFGHPERDLLEAAAILHDIGWIRGQKRHHKLSQKIIMRSYSLRLSRRDRMILGLISRYHRKSLPKRSHQFYGSLDPVSRKTVDTLAAILRLADGLDSTHRSSARGVRCSVAGKTITIRIECREMLPEEGKTSLEKSDLMEKVFKRKVRILRSL